MAGCRVGIDVGATNIKIGLFDENMALQDQMQTLTDQEADIDRLMDVIVGFVGRILTKNGLDITGEIETEAEMCELLAAAIKRFAKRQMTWFRRDKEIHWLNMRDDPAAEADALIRTFLEN